MSTKKDCLDRTWESPSVLNVLYKSFHVRRNMSRFWSFPLISFRPNLAVSPLTNGLTPHEVQRHRRGGGGNYLFIAPVALARWLSLSFLPRLVGECRGQYAGPRCLENTLLCAMVLSQHNSRQSVWWGCCQPPTWATNFEAGLQYNIIYSFATVEIIQRFLWTWDHTRSDQKEALVGCLTVSKSTHVCFPSPQMTVITEIILH